MNGRWMKIGVVACLLLASCGLFKDDSSANVKLITPSVVVGVVEDEYDLAGHWRVGEVVSLAVRGDTLLVLTLRNLYMVLPGQSMTRLKTSWEYQTDLGTFATDTTSPLANGWFVGEKDRLFISDASGEIWKVGKIGDAIFTYPPEIQGTYRRATWVGSKDSLGIALLETGDAYKSNVIAGGGWHGFLTTMRGLSQSIPFQIGDSVYFNPQSQDLVAISMVDLGQRIIAAPSTGSKWCYLPCDSTVCAVDSTGFYRYRNGLWTKLKMNIPADYELSAGVGNMESLVYQGKTLFYAVFPRKQSGNALIVFGTMTGDSIAVRALNASGPSGDGHAFVVWNNNLVISSANSVVAIPMSEVLSWK